VLEARESETLAAELTLSTREKGLHRALEIDESFLIYTLGIVRPPVDAIRWILLPPVPSSVHFKRTF
jgi:hypothetical protein